jgi:hypothetical protein
MRGRYALISCLLATTGLAGSMAHGAVTPAAGFVGRGTIDACSSPYFPLAITGFHLRYFGRIQHNGKVYTATRGIGEGEVTCDLGHSLTFGSLLVTLTSTTPSGTFTAWCGGQVLPTPLSDAQPVQSLVQVTYFHLVITCHDYSTSTFRLVATLEKTGGGETPFSPTLVKGPYVSVGAGDPLGTGLYPPPP